MPAPGTNSSFLDYYVTILIEVTSAASCPAQPHLRHMTYKRSVSIEIVSHEPWV